MTNIFDRIKKIPPNELENAGIIFRANKSGYICPLCGNGTGETGDGLSVKEFQWGFNYHCFKCGENLTAVDLLAEYYGYPKSREGLSTVAEKAKELFGIAADESRFIPSSAKDDFDIVADEKDYSEFYSTVQSQLVEIGESFRGLSFEDLRAVGAGVATPSDFKKIDEKIYTNCLILPFNSGHFFIRQLHDDPKSEYKPIKRGNTGCHKEIYNPYGVNFDKPVFVVEGIMDCLSIHAAGFPAVATDGLKWEVILSELKKCKSTGINPKIIIMFDNDKAGKDAAIEAVDGLKQAGYMAAKYFLDYGEKKVDANDLLQKDKAILATCLNQIYGLAGVEFEKMKVETILSTANGGVVRLSDVFDELDTVTAKIRKNSLKTGFPSIDEKFPMLPGVILLGGLPSMGKTTFAMNIAANICEQGISVLYVNFEQEANRLAYKDLARYWYLKNRKEHLSADYTPTATQMMLGEYFANSSFTVERMKAIREELKERHKKFFYLQGTIETAENLIAKISPYVVSGGVKFVVIDYIQLIINSDERANKREGLDATIRSLQKFQLDNDIVILFVSSFNRQNYREFISFESFKESGGLEYSADTILGLQFKLDNERDRSNNAKIQQMKMETPRKIQLVCIKQRYGENFDCVLDYYSAHDTFIDRTASDDFDEDL